MADLRECDRSVRGHAWYESDEDVAWQPGRKYIHRQTDRCERCSMLRVTCFDRYMELVARWYESPPGWSERWGTGNTRPSGPEIRLMMAQKNAERRRTK